MDRLSGLDASFLYLETPEQLMHVCGLILLDPSTIPGGYNFEKLRDHLGERAQQIPTFMAQVWTMYGLGGKPSEDDPLHAMMNVLTDAGFTAVLGTNSEQSYERYLRVGEQVRIETALDSVVGPKATGMGVGYFVTSKSTWFVGDEQVATMLFRVLKFIPRTVGDS